MYSKFLRFSFLVSFSLFILGCGGSGSSSSGETASGSEYTLLAWNDLGMHCMDADYSVFSILPPFNNLHAQLKQKDGSLITSGVTLTYQSEPSAAGIYNSTSTYTLSNDKKSNFWSYVDELFGTSLAEDTGLTGTMTTSTVPLAMTFNTSHQWWEAEGIPITPIEDDGSTNYFPRVRVIAKDASGTVLAQAVTVLPVSDEMDCRICHGSTSGYNDAKPSSGWVNDADADKDYKRNILRLHDELHPSAVADHSAALATAGYIYDNAGLEATQNNAVPILCASCHSSNALPGTGINGITPLTQALHGGHAGVIDPQTNLTLESSSNRTACYRCHPGSVTQCLRGAMGNADMDCQNCHGNMSAVGSANRKGWLEEPNCQACHQNTHRYTDVSDTPGSGILRTVLDNRFATNANTPATGYSLYRFSKGHGDLQCEACHGATHAIYPSSEAGDNLLSQMVQGHSGTIAECSSCHTSVPLTNTGGPHGMHTVGQTWVSKHEDYAENNPVSCQACHGSDYRGTFLSKTSQARVFTVEHSTKSYASGAIVGCYDCHNGPYDD